MYATFDLCMRCLPVTLLFVVPSVHALREGLKLQPYLAKNSP